ncbi:MAG: hypothetical protein PHY25_05185, partial [Dehalococcoidales bacterium]|nr:hypothetical protein [Dehalococcoidales bacterium]
LLPFHLHSTMHPFNTEGGEIMEEMKNRSTIGIKMSTKDRLDMRRAPGQCYDGFICQMMDMWDEKHNNHH